MAERSF